MTNRTAKKWLSLAMALVMLLGLFVPAYAEDAAPQTVTAAAFTDVADRIFSETDGQNASGDGQLAANIIFPGISQSNATYCDENGTPILDDNGEEFSGGLLIIDTRDLVKKLLKKLLWPVLSTLLLQHTNSKLAQRVYEAVYDLFYVQQCDNEGVPKQNLVLDRYNCPLSQFDQDSYEWFYRMFPMQPVINAMNKKFGVNGEDYTYLYTFPLIGNPMESAEGIFDFIEMVKQQTGCEKVNLIQISMGGTMLTGYLDLVRERGGDYSDINKIINIVASLDGTDLFADFLEKNVDLSDEYLYRDLIPAVMKENGMQPWVGYLVNAALRIFPKNALVTIIDSALDGVLDSIVLNDPQFWAVLPNDRYEAIAERYLTGEEHAVLREKVERFQLAKRNLPDNLQAAVAAGANVYSVGGYNLTYAVGDYNFFGLNKSKETCSSDAIVDIESASLGATHAPAGQSLGVTGEYVSPDGNVDASTCLFPETTWFFNGQHHEVGRDDVIIRLLGQIVVGNVSDIHSDPNFPQFNFNRNTKRLTRPDWLLDTAEGILNDADSYDASAVAEIRKWFDAGCALLSRTVMTAEDADQATEIDNELRRALKAVGADDGPDEPSALDNFLNKALKKLDDANMRFIGGQGFSDKAKNPLGIES